MGRYLVVGNQTLGSDELRAVLEQRASDDPDCQIHVVVPQTAVRHYRWTVTGRPEVAAAHRLALTLEDLSSLDATVSGAVGDENPLTAIRHAVAAESYDEVILSTYPEGASGWLGTGLTGHIVRHVDVPLTHVRAATLDPVREGRRRYAEVLRQLAQDV